MFSCINLAKLAENRLSGHALSHITVVVVFILGLASQQAQVQFLTSCFGHVSI